MTYFHAFRHYRWPHQLNGRVRNGNVCFLMGKVTGMHPDQISPIRMCMKRWKQCVFIVRLYRGASLVQLIVH